MDTAAEPLPDPSAMTPALDRRLAGTAGVLAAAVALGVGELASTLSPNEQSLIGGVGDWFIDGPGQAIAKPAIALFGTNDKPALVIGIVVCSLVIGWFVGRASIARPWVGPAAFATFGVAGAAAGITDALADPAWAVVSATCAAATGAATLWVLLRVATTGRSLPVTTTQTIVVPGSQTGDRRAFFAWAGAAGAFAATAGVASRSRRGPSAAEQARATLRLPDVSRTTSPSAIDATATARASFDVPDLSPYITPNDRFYRIDTALVTPEVDPASWKLDVLGKVDRPFELTFDELLALPMIEAPVTLSCVSNEVGGGLVGNAVWQGVPLTTILERAGVQDGGEQLIGRSVDGFTVGFPTEAALDGRVAMVAVGMNGEPLPVRHGFPARLVVSGLYGYVSATKWLGQLELTGWDDFDAYWIPRGWSKEAPIKTQSRVDVPRNRQKVTAGPTPIAGVAWAPGRGISRVEVQVDGGEWRDAQLGPVLNDDTWRQWVATWDATPGDHEVRVRATDGDGETQTDRTAPPAPDGATGWHLRRFTVT